MTAEMKEIFMKKSAIFLLALCIASVICCGCSKAGGDADDEKSTPAVVVGSDEYEPFNYVDENGDFAGIDVELAQEAFGRMGYRPVFKNIVWEDKNRYLEDEEVDCLWGSFTMTDREGEYEWAGPYMYSRQIVVVHADSDIYELADLEGKRVAVQATSKPESVFLNTADARIPHIGALYSFSTMDEIYSCLRKRYADAIAGHEGALSSFMKTSPGTYRILDESLYTSELGVAFKNGRHSSMSARLTEILDDMKRDGTTERIIKKYGLDSDYALKGQAGADD